LNDYIKSLAEKLDRILLPFIGDDQIDHRVFNFVKE
jgi:hypothetical protein